MKIVKFLLLVFWLPCLLWGQNVSNLRFKTIDENPLEMKSVLARGPVLLVFWATWCKPCQSELTALEKIHERFASRGLSLLAIAIDSPRSLSKVKTFVKRSQLPYTFLIDPDGIESSKVFVKEIPYLLLADGSGQIVYSHRGYRKGDEKEVAEKAAALLSESSIKAKTSQGGK